MTTCLFTGYNDAYAPLARLTAPLMAHYASRHGYGFDCYKDWSLPQNYLPMDVPNRIYWTGVAGALAKLRNGYDRVIYLDVDQVITNPENDFDNLTFGLHVSKDWGADAVEHWHFSACGIIAHRDCIPLLEETLSMEPAWRDKSFPEQGPLRAVVRNRLDRMEFYDIKPGEQKWNAAINVHPRRVLNAVPKEVDPTVQEPWQPGDFAAHLTNLPLDKRIELFHEIKKQAGV